MTDHHVDKDLYIRGGNQEHKIKGPVGSECVIEGQLNVVDRDSDLTNPNNVGSILVNGTNIFDAEPERTTNGDYTLTASDFKLNVFKKGTAAANIIQLPPASEVHPKKYVIVFRNMEQTDKHYAVVRAAGSAGPSGAAVRDNYLKEGQILNSKWWSEYGYLKPGAVSIETTIGTFTGGTTNGWIITNSHNQYSDSGNSYLEPVQLASTANIADLASPGASIDGAALDEFDRVLLKDQSTASENGVYRVNEDGGLIRAIDVPDGSEAYTHFVHVNTGSVNANKTFRCYNTVGDSVVGTDDLLYAQQAPTGSTEGSIQFVDSSGYGVLSNSNVKVLDAQDAIQFTRHFGVATGDDILLADSTQSGNITLGRIQNNGTNVSISNYLGNTRFAVSTQSTSITTTVDATNHPTGRIDTVSSTLAAGASATFTVTVGGAWGASGEACWYLSTFYQGAGHPYCYVSAKTTSSFDITIVNVGSVALNDIIEIEYSRFGN